MVYQNGYTNGLTSTRSTSPESQNSNQSNENSLIDMMVSTIYACTNIPYLSFSYLTSIEIPQCKQQHSTAAKSTKTTATASAASTAASTAATTTAISIPKSSTWSKTGIF